MELWGQEKSYHQQGIGMRCLTLQASPSRDTVDPPGPHPHAGLPLCWHELAGRPGRGAQREEWLPEGAKRGLPHQPPAPCAGGTSPPEELLPASERWDTEREPKLRAPQPQPRQSLPCPLWVWIWEQLSLIPSSQAGLGTKGPVSRQPPNPPPSYRQAEHAAHGRWLWGGDTGSLPS